MSYLRTKDSIYLIQKDISYGGNKIYKVYNHDFAIIGNDFKVANNLEELCDEFIYNDPEYDLPQRCYQNYRGEWYDEQRIRCLTNEEVLTIKGAIWTNKGLQFVAHMNDKVVLELI